MTKSELYRYLYQAPRVDYDKLMKDQKMRWDGPRWLDDEDEPTTNELGEVSP